MECRPVSFACSIPALPTVQRDDEDVRITRWDFAPGAATGWHEHGHPYFVVLLTDGVMRYTDGMTITDNPVVAGQSYQRPRGVRHDVMNPGPAPLAFVEIELKRPAAVSF